MAYIIKCNSYRLLKSKLDELTNNIDKENIIYFDYDETNMKSIIEECNYTSLFNDSKAIIVRNINIFGTKYEYKEDLSILEDYLNNENRNTLLIFITDSTSLKKKCVKIIKDSGNLLDIPIPKDKELELAIREYLNKLGYKIESNALTKLIDNLDSNYDYILNELDKIIIVKKDYVINLNDINKYSINIKKDNIFDFVDLIIKKDKLMYEHMEEFINSKEEPAILLSNLATQYRLIYASKNLTREGMSEKEIADALEVHPYRVKLAIANSYNYSCDELKEKLLYIGKLDELIKTGLLDKYTALKLFITSV